MILLLYYIITHMDIDVSKTKLEIKRLAHKHWHNAVKEIFKDGNSVIPVRYQSINNSFRSGRMSPNLCLLLENAWVNLDDIKA
jgi:hypothetical protein